MSLTFDCQMKYPSGFCLRVAFAQAGGVTALFGPSGSGKTTILGLVAGLLRPQQGLIRLGDHVLTDTSAGLHLPPEQRRIGMVFQDHCLFPHLSVRQNLEYGLKRRPLRKFNLDRVAKILELETLLTRQPHTLSGGQKQRVALGRALLRGPDLLLLDEPLSALDAPLQDRILSYLERVLGEYQLPTLLVTHDLKQVQRLADQVVRLDAGAVAEEPEVVREAIG